MNIFAPKRTPEEVQSEFETNFEANLARAVAARQQEIRLTFLGGNRAEYREYEEGAAPIAATVNGEAHWQAMIEHARANAQAKSKKLVVVNPRRDANPYEAGCPVDEYDYRREA